MKTATRRIRTAQIFFTTNEKSISRVSTFANVYVDLARNFIWRSTDCYRRPRGCRWCSGGLFPADRCNCAGLEFDAREIAIVRASSERRLVAGHDAHSGVVRQKWLGLGQWSRWSG